MSVKGISPNVKIIAMLIIAVALLTTVTAVSLLAGRTSEAEQKLAAVDGSSLQASTQGSLQAGADEFDRQDEATETEEDKAVEEDKDTITDEDVEFVPGDSSEKTDAMDAASDTVSKAVLDPKSAPLPFDGVLEYGMDDDVIAKVQKKFMELNYMEPDETTTHFGPITREATSAFQRRNGLEVTGKIDEETYRCLMADDALAYMVSLGDDGDDVSGIQDRLYEMGYLAMKPTGYYGDLTEAAVKEFQKRNNLSPDGKVGVETRELLYSSEAEPNVWSKGDDSDALIPYQKRLKELGYFVSEADGKYGSETKQAVKRFQGRNGLIADGNLGPKTIEILMDDDAIANSLSLGYSGDDVEEVQQRLYKLGYVKKSSVTGYFGSATEYAVRAFQKRNDLTVDGRVGKKTLSCLMSDDAKKPGSSYKYYSEPVDDDDDDSGSGSSNNGGGSSSSSPSVSRLINAAKSRLGCRYVTGGKGPNKFDCSGLVYWCLNEAGINQSYMTSYAWRSVSKYRRIKSLDSLRAGDIIVFYGHVGIIVSDSEMIDASSTRGKVVRRSFKTNWCREEFICGYRIFD